MEAAALANNAVVTEALDKTPEAQRVVTILAFLRGGAHMEWYADAKLTTATSEQQLNKAKLVFKRMQRCSDEIVTDLKLASSTLTTHVKTVDDALKRKADEDAKATESTCGKLYIWLSGFWQAAQSWECLKAAKFSEAKFVR